MARVCLIHMILKREDTCGAGFFMAVAVELYLSCMKSCCHEAQVKIFSLLKWNLKKNWKKKKRIKSDWYVQGPLQDTL